MSRAELGKQLLNKHLGGPSGKEKHPSGTPQTIHNEGRMGAGQYVGEFFRDKDVQENIITTVGLTAYMGLMVLPVVPPGVIIQGVKNLPKVPVNAYKSTKGIQQLKALPDTDKFKFLASYMNDGGKLTKKMKAEVPEAYNLDKGISKWTSGDQDLIRQYLVSGQKGVKQNDALGMAIASAPETSIDLFRGMSVSNKEALKRFTTKGETFHLGPTGFSSSKGVANTFAGGGFGFADTADPSIVFKLNKGSHALNVEKSAGVFKWEREWLSSGRFQVDEVVKKGKRYEVTITQVDLHIPNVYTLPTTKQMAAAQSEVAKKLPQTAIATMHKNTKPKWWADYGISDDVMGQSGLLSGQSWIVDAAGKTTQLSTKASQDILTLTKRAELAKALMRSGRHG